MDTRPSSLCDWAAALQLPQFTPREERHAALARKPNTPLLAAARDIRPLACTDNALREITFQRVASGIPRRVRRVRKVASFTTVNHRPTPAPQSVQQRTHQAA